MTSSECVPTVRPELCPKCIGGGKGGGQRAMAPLEIWGEGPTYTLAPLEFWPNFEKNWSHIDDYLWNNEKFSLIVRKFKI